MVPGPAPCTGRHVRPASCARPGVLAVVGLVLASVCSAQTDLPAPEWDHDLVLGSNAGYAQLRWTPPPGDSESDVHWVFQLQEGRSEDFARTDRQYEGQHTSSFVSGLEDGAFYFRVRARHPDQQEWGEWSRTLRVDVQHHARSFALTLMGIGAAVFLATAAFLFAHRNAPIEVREEGANE